VYIIDSKHIVEDQVQIPVELRKSGTDLFVVSLIWPRGYFRDPFFIDSLARLSFISKSEIKLPEEDELLARPVHYDEKDRRVTYTPVDEFIEKYLRMKTDKKLGFIFHVSRCGSTLVAQMLACNDRFFVLSEPTIINAVLDPALNVSQEKRDLLLKASIQSLACCSPTICERVFIKFRSWNTLYLNQILKNFPNIPWMFIHRNGLEVLQSVVEKPPGWVRSRINYAKYFSAFLKINKEEIISMNNDEYVTRMLGTFCRIAKEAISKKKIFVDYYDFNNSLIVAIYKLWDIELNVKEINMMNQVSQLYSKDVNKAERFKPDSKSKKARATKIQEELADKFVEEQRIKLINL